MKLTKKLEAEIRKLYEVYWNSYINGDLETYASLLDEDFKFIGSTEAEPLLNKKDSIKLLDAVKEQMAGKAEFRNRNIKVELIDEMILVSELCDGYILIGTEWNFYSRFRLSSLLKKKRNKWKFIHQHVSMPDSKAQEGEAYGLEQIRTENIQLRDAVKRRTIELENKNRELEIEWALERVRAQAMAMKKPDDLMHIVEVLFAEINKLGFNELRNAMIQIHNDAAGSFLEYDFSHVTGLSLNTILYNDHPVTENLLRQVRSANDAFAEVVVSGSELKDWREHRIKAGEKDDPRLGNVDALSYYFYSIGIGSIGISTYSSITEEKRNLLKRFRNVFDLSYRRFMDIQKAEAQAKESQIQLALERVRARTMAMQRSDELMETAVVLFDQLNQLGENIERTIIGVMNEEERVVDVWATRPDGSQMDKMQKFPIDEPILMQKVYVAWRQQKKSIVIDLRGEELENYFQFLKGRSSRLKRESFGERRVENFAFFSKGILGVISADPKIPANVKLYERFAAVFEQTYTRFLDLQKAEAQAREAEIELALERVRARTMAMQKSEELGEVSHVMNEQLQRLNFKNYLAGFLIDYRNSNDFEVWRSDPSGLLLTKIRVPYFDHPVFNAFVESKEKGLDFNTICLTFEEKNKWVDHAIQYSPPVSAEMKEFVYKGAGYAASVAYMKNVALFMENFEGTPFSDEENAILKRFGKVFEQTYTRFLDLQKAEAQAREAKIEAALEKVRSRTMAMQRSDELADVAQLLFQQVKALGIEAWTTGFNIWQEDNASYVDWVTDPTGEFLEPYTVHLTKHPIFAAIREARQRGDDFFVSVLEGKQIVETYELLNRFGDRGQFQKMLDSGIQFPTRQINHFVFGAQVSLLFITYEPCPEAWDIFKRFGKVFEQTYTRFLDLKKAEAQAREAKIEAALERVRSRTMAMHKSDELNETNTVIIQQIRSLEIRLYAFGIHICHADEPISEAWMGDPVGGYMPKVRYDHSRDPLSIRMYAGWKEGKALAVEKLEGDALKEHFSYMITLVPDRSIFDNVVAPESLVFHFAYFTFGFLVFLTQEPCPEEHSIFKRLANVFEQTYTRFLDLQKAEAQSREAQIELGLERVRARAMAMQKSDELREAVLVIYEQLKLVHFESSACNIIIIDKESNSAQYWVSGFSQEIFPVGYTVPYFNHPYQDALLKPWKQGDKYVVYEYAGKMKQNFDEIFFTQTDFKNVPDEVKNVMIGLKSVMLSTAFMTYGALQSLGAEPLSDENANILQRFAKVFEQTYTRFLDLQKAEAQAREAQIEAALERVRSRTMGMQKSEELKEVIQVVYEQFVHLNIHVEHTGFIMDYNKRDDMHIWLADKHAVPFQVTIPYFDCAHWNSFKEAKEKGIDFFTNQLSFQEKNKFYQDLFKLIPGVPEETLEYYFSCPGLAISTVLLENVGLYIENFSGNPYTDEENNTLMRFGKVFQQTYTRFLDLQKAEAQAKEAKIEAALERVRSRSMGMQKSDELAEVVAVLYKQFEELDFGLYQVLVSIYDKKSNIIEWWSRGFGDVDLPQRNIIPIIDHPFPNDLLEKWEKGVEYYPHILEGKMKKSWDEYLFTKTDLKNFPKEVKDTMKSIEKVYLSDVFMKYGSLQAAGATPLPDDKAAILRRFVKVLDLAYTRMKDLQTAEAQAREAQIELGLERVRSRAMAMQTSEELNELIGTVFTELTKLDLVLTRCVIWVFEPTTNEPRWWMANSEEPSNPMNFLIKYHEHPAYLTFLQEWKKQNVKFVYDLRGEDKISWDNILFNETELVNLPDVVKNGMRAPERVLLSASFNNFGGINVASLEPLSDEHFDILLRFAKVFDLTYTRFNDLKQAEAQARESQIQLALERVRARTMAMQKSDELPETSYLLFQQVKELGLTTVQNSIGIVNEEAGFVELSTTVQGHHLPHTLKVPIDDPYVMAKAVAAWKAKRKSLKVEFEGQELKNYNEHRNSFFETKVNFPEDQWIVNIIFFSKGWLSFSSDKNISGETFDLLKRFAAVFEQTYTRFSDLKQAETQAREAKIETALERVRSNTMAMHHSEELKEVISVTFEQLKSLNIIIDSCIINLFIEGSDDLNVWVASAEQKYPQKVRVPYLKHPLFDKTTPSKNKSGNSFTLKLSQKENQVFYKHIIENSDFGKIINEDRRKLVMNADSNIMSFANFKHTGLRVGNFRNHVYTDVENKTILRFANVFEQTYTRFLDLQKAEAQARETVKQASVDRIRAEIASMRTTNDLERIQPLIWNELTTLGVPFTRCGVFIMDEEHEQVHTFLSTPEGRSIASFTAAFSNVAVITEALPYWRRKEIYKTHWDEATFLAQAKTLLQQGNITSTETYLTEHRPKDLYLHFLPFLQGILYVGNETPLNDEELQLVQNLADAFSIAYARYEDFNKLELAKEQIENTLVDLKQTQAQLVQSEKMASLGELTAGIAHEIQNPLNFVNNFSEVNKELLAEMNEEIEKGNLEEVKTLAKDVIGNEEKINHHGKRADAIVKGMLQHSRSNSGVKESADINVLADEYLRLAYHGLRAKDKSFNATMKTDFDETIGKINIVPQDVGRSVLNLINNAFYAVSEKKKQNTEGYEPTVTVTTKRINGKVEIRVADNGNGIPQKVLDKIFQPFFTTKPTGHGTGLGLSLSYDIIKAHGGEINVETKEGEGSEFFIFLPANN